MIHVLHIVSRLRRHGPITQLLNLVRYSNPARFRHTVLTLSAEAADSMLDEFTSLVDVCTCDAPPTTAPFLALPEVHACVKRLNPALIHVSDVKATVAAAFLRRGRPRLVTRREAFKKTRIASLGFAVGWTTETIHTAACRRMERVVAVSEYVRGAAVAAGLTQVRVILNGVDQDRYRVASLKERTALRRQLGLDDLGTIVVSSGSLIPLKDPLTAVRGVIAHNQNGHRTGLVMLGAGPLIDACRRAAAGYQGIRFPGFVHNVHEYLRCADAFLSTSRLEGCPNAVIEALACGVPAVLSAIDPHREILDQRTLAGALFRPGDPTSLADALTALLEEPLSQRVAAARSVVECRYSARLMAAAYEDCYTEMLDSNGTSA